jgi:hypothetical protein
MSWGSYILDSLAIEVCGSGVQEDRISVLIQLNIRWVQSSENNFRFENAFKTLLALEVLLQWAQSEKQSRRSHVLTFANEKLTVAPLFFSVAALTALPTGPGPQK